MAGIEESEAGCELAAARAVRWGDPAAPGIQGSEGAIRGGARELERSQKAGAARRAAARAGAGRSGARRRGEGEAEVARAGGAQRQESRRDRKENSARPATSREHRCRE